MFGTSYINDLFFLLNFKLFMKGAFHGTDINEIAVFVLISNNFYSKVVVIKKRKSIEV